MDDDDFAELFKSLPGQSAASTSWEDVGAEVQRLGRTVGEVVRAVWQRQGEQASLRELQRSVQLLIEQANAVVEGTREAQETRELLRRLTDALRAAAERAGDDLRPELFTLLRQANAELRRRSGLDE